MTAPASAKYRTPALGGFGSATLLMGQIVLSFHGIFSFSGYNWTVSVFMQLKRFSFIVIFLFLIIIFRLLC